VGDAAVRRKKAGDVRRLVFLGATIERGQREEIDKLAARDRRSRSSMLRVLLDRAFTQMGAAR